MYQAECNDFDNFSLKQENVESESCWNFKKAFCGMHSMRKRGLFCDVTLMAKNVEIPAHKVVLASCSAFFRDSFAAMGEENHLILDQVEGKALSVLIDYIYTFRIEMEINPINVQDLLAGANILQLKDIRRECYKYLETHLNLNTSLKILSVARDQKCMDLLNKAETFVDKNVMEIIKTQEFLSLPIDQVTHLITRDTLDVPSEEKIYEGVISWVKHDLMTRKKHLSALMSYVRLSLISRDYLAKYIRNEPLIKTDLQCKDLIIDALLSEHIPQMIKPKVRKGCQPNQVLLIMGGGQSEIKRTFELYDFKTNRWSQIYYMPVEKSAYNLAFINQKVYAVSKHDISEYDLVKNCWCNSIKMNSVKRYCNVGILNNCVYVIGSYFTDENCVNSQISVERFDISKQRWRSIAPMSVTRYWSLVGVFNNLLYALGGRSGNSLKSTPLKSVEFYDSKLNVWKRSSDLITARTDAAIGTLHNKMYVIGGWDGNKALTSVECYTPEIGFTQSASLNIPRSGSAVVVFDDKLYVIGGRDGSQPLDSIEVYCPENGKWEILPTSMNVPRYAHGAVMVDKIIDF